MNGQPTRCGEAASCPGEGAWPNRRTLLGGAAAGFVLAASGLFLPTDDRAAAGEGAYSGALGGRRGKDQRGQDKRKRRERGSKNDGRENNKDNPPRSGGAWENELVVRVSNLRSQPVEVQGWIGSSQGWTIANDWWWSTLPAKPSSGPAASKDFELMFAQQGMAVEIGREAWVHCFMLSGVLGAAIWPGWATTAQFHSHDRHGSGVLAFSNDVAVNSSFATPDFRIKRLSNTGRKTMWLSIDLT